MSESGCGLSGRPGACLLKQVHLFSTIHVRYRKTTYMIGITQLLAWWNMYGTHLVGYHVYLSYRIKVVCYMYRILLFYTSFAYWFHLVCGFVVFQCKSCLMEYDVELILCFVGMASVFHPIHTHKAMYLIRFLSCRLILKLQIDCCSSIFSMEAGCIFVYFLYLQGLWFRDVFGPC